MRACVDVRHIASVVLRYNIICVCIINRLSLDESFLWVYRKYYYKTSNAVLVCYHKPTKEDELMFLKKLIIENFKAYSGKHTAEFDKNLCFFVGNNNCGKSTFFEAIDFLKSGLPSGKTVSDIQNKNVPAPITVTAEFVGNIREIITNFSESKYLSYVFEKDGQETIIIRRTSAVSKIIQNGKEVEINIKKITIWNESTEQFENPAGIDTTFKTLFETQFIWANTNPDDITDFGSTKICGKLIYGSIGNFFATKQWEDFREIHEKTFTSGEDCLSSRMNVLENKLQDLLNEQYGKATVKFDFHLPDTNSFIKSGVINIDDGTNTSSKEKGTGMQRALAIALIQTYADELCKSPEDPDKNKPLFMFIDEPETFLHPQAQMKLLESLNTIANSQQVFITTHSPFLLKSFDKSKNSLFLFYKEGNVSYFHPGNDLNLFGNSSPTWGEIIYSAYGIPNVEFHNELYGFAQAKAIETDSKYQCENKFDDYLNDHGIKKLKHWIKESKGAPQPAQATTLQTYIRNYIHHPENTYNAAYTTDELKRSIDELIQIVNATTH